MTAIQSRSKAAVGRCRVYPALSKRGIHADKRQDKREKRKQRLPVCRALSLSFEEQYVKRGAPPPLPATVIAERFTLLLYSTRSARGLQTHPHAHGVPKKTDFEQKQKQNTKPLVSPAGRAATPAAHYIVAKRDDTHTPAALTNEKTDTTGSGPARGSRNHRPLALPISSPNTSPTQPLVGSGRR